MKKEEIMAMLYTAGGVMVGTLVANMIKKKVPFFNASGDFMMYDGGFYGADGKETK